MNDHTTWVYRVVEFAEPVPCHDPHIGASCDTDYGVLTVVGVGQGDVRPVCIYCARKVVQQGTALTQWRSACQEIIDRDGDYCKTRDELLEKITETKGEKPVSGGFTGCFVLLIVALMILFFFGWDINRGVHDAFKLWFP